MTPKRLTLTIVIVTCGLLLHAGCEEEVAAPQQLNPYWFQQFQQPVRQQPTQPATASAMNQPAPTITFEKVVHDFGDVGPQTKHYCEFKFMNTGSGILRIADVNETCGCTLFSLAKTQYAPGESGTLKVQYNADEQFGQVAKNLSVRSNDRTNPEVTLAIKATIMTKVDYEPKTLSLLLKQENAGCPKITLTSTDGQPFSISHFRSTADYITADYNPSVKAISYVLQPKIDMARLGGQASDERIEIGLTHPECKTVTLDVKTIPRFKISPAQISAREVQPGQSIVKKVRILNNYNEVFSLESAASGKGAVEVLSSEAVSNGYELQVRITTPLAAGTRAGVFTETLYLKTNDGDQLEIPCNVLFSRVTASSPSRLFPTSTKKPEKCKICGPRIISSSGVNMRGY